MRQVFRRRWSVRRSFWGIDSRVFCLQSRQEFAAGPPRLGFKPFAQIRRRSNERVRTATALFCFDDWPICRTSAALLPGGSQARQEKIDRLRNRAGVRDRLGIGKRRKPLLRH